MDQNLKEKILAEYPYPISIFYKKMLQDERLVKRKKGTYQTLFFSLLDLFEMMNRFLAICAVSQYVHDGATSDKLNDLLKNKFQKNLSLGDWQEILRETIRNFNIEEQDNNSFRNQLYRFYYKTSGGKAKYQAIVEYFNEMIHIRNKKRGHSPNLTPVEYEQLYLENHPKVMEMLSEISFLSEFSLISPIEYTNNELLEYLQMKGANVTECFTPLSLKSDEIDEGEIYLYSNDYYLKLSPLSFYDLDYEAEMEQYLWLYEGNKMVKNTVKSLTYYGFTPTPKNKLQSIDDENKEKQLLLSQFLQLVSVFFKEEMTKILESHVGEPSVEDYYFQSQRGLIDYYRASFFGREKDFQSIQDFIHNEPSGYYLIEGVPGQGKTALMAYLVYEHDLPHHFISRNESRDDEEAIIKSLMVQIAKKMGREIPPIPTKTQDLKRSFQNYIQTYSDFCVAEETKGVIVIDGLDELKNLEETITLDFLPHYLPKNIMVILSSRPITQLTKLETKLATKYILSELSFEAIKTIIEKRIDKPNYETIRQLFLGSHGNPLLLKCMLDQYVQTGDVRNLLKIESIFESFVVSLRQHDDNLPLQILGVLIVSKDALSVYEIGRIVKRPKYKVLKAIQLIRQFLIRTESRYQVFHKKLVEFLTNPEEELSFDDEELMEFHRLISDYCEEQLESFNEYRERFWAYHLYHLKRYNSIVSLAAGIEYQPSIIEVIKDQVLHVSHHPVQINNMKSLVKSFVQNAPDQLSVLLNAIDKTLHKGAFQIVHELLDFIGEFSPYGSADDQKMTYLLTKVYREKGDLQKAQELFTRLMQEGDLQFNREEKMKLYLEIGNLMREKGDREQAIRYYELALQHCDKEQALDDYLDIYHHICDMVYVQGKFNKALTDLNGAISLAKEHGLTLHLGKLLRIKGQVFYVLDLYEEAIACYKDGLDCFISVNDPIQLGKMYNNISEAYVFTDIEEAKKFNLAALELNKMNHKKLETGKSEMIYGMIEREMGNYKESEEWFGRSTITLTEVGYKSGVGKALYQKALMYLKNHQWEQAWETSLRSNDLFIKRKTAGYQIFIIKNYYLQYFSLLKLGKAEEAEGILSTPFPGMECFEEVEDVYLRTRMNIEKNLNAEIQSTI